MVRKAGQHISRGPRAYVVRISLGGGPETGTRKYRNKKIRGSFREAKTCLNTKLRERGTNRFPGLMPSFPAQCPLRRRAVRAGLR